MIPDGYQCDKCERSTPQTMILITFLLNLPSLFGLPSLCVSGANLHGRRVAFEEGLSVVIRLL